jgi:hypothetical protein
MFYKRLILLSLACVALSACSTKLGWGVLLWSTEDPPIPSGTVLPVYIKSNIDKVWVVGLPDSWKKSEDEIDKIEVPLSRFELVGSKASATKRAAAFMRYALVYAENLQDGLPIRDNPDNNARRIYRMKSGEIVKILSLAQGRPAVNATGEPLPGDWYRVLTEDGNVGFCFSYRLKLFEHSGGPLAVSASDVYENTSDPALDVLMSKTWSHESYRTMLNNKRLILEDLQRNWRFDPGQETGIARILAPGVDLSFSYTSIRSDGPRAWRFEGTSLYIQTRSDTSIAVQYTEGAGSMKTLLFVLLSSSVDDLVIQETARRRRLYYTIYNQGPVFTSNNYGTITFREGGGFSWTGFDLLVPQYLPESATQAGTMTMDLFLSPSLGDRFNGAFTMRFKNQGGSEAAALRCIYSLDSQGFRLEIVPWSNIEDALVTDRAASPVVLYFFKDSGIW